MGSACSGGSGGGLRADYFSVVQRVCKLTKLRTLNFGIADPLVSSASKVLRLKVQPEDFCTLDSDGSAGLACTFVAVQSARVSVGNVWILAGLALPTRWLESGSKQPYTGDGLERPGCRDSVPGDWISLDRGFTDPGLAVWFNPPSRRLSAEKLRTVRTFFFFRCVQSTRTLDNSWHGNGSTSYVIQGPSVRRLDWEFRPGFQA